MNRTICDVCGADCGGTVTKIKVVGVGIPSLTKGISADGADLCKTCASAIHNIVRAQGFRGFAPAEAASA